MESFILTFALGAGFIFLGRWLSRNPKKLGPSWGILNQENPTVQRVSRAYAILLTFIGTFACSVTLSEHLVSGLPAVAFAFTIAVVGTGLLRPRVTEPVLEPVAADLNAIHGEEKLLAKHWKLSLAIAVGLGTLVTIFAFVPFADSDVSKLPFVEAQASPIVSQQLGEPIQRGFFTSGSIEVSGPSGRAAIEIPLRGPRGKATLFGVAQKTAGVWKFDTLEVEFDGKLERVDLLKKTTDAGHPSTP